jgi:hypothetical protein
MKAYERYKKMTAEEFSAFEPMLTSMTKDRILAAKLRLVDGFTYSKIAAFLEWQDRQAVQAASDLVWNKYIKFLEVADDIKVARKNKPA